MNVIKELKRSEHVLELSGQQASAVIGVSYHNFKKLRQTDDPPPMTFDKKFRTDELGEWIRRYERRKMLGSADEPDALDPVKERARKDKAMADRYELDNQVKRGELLDLATVESAAFDVVMRVRSRLLRMPSAASPLLLGLDDRVEIQMILENEIRDALTELSGDWTGKGDEDSE